MAALVLVVWMAQAAAAPAPVVTCRVIGDAAEREYELRREEHDGGPRWSIAMRSKEAGRTPVLLPLPDATPVVTSAEVSLDYHTFNGGREVKWRVSPSGARLELHANFELEVNVEPDLDPRVELMNTEGAITNLSCSRRPGNP